MAMINARDRLFKIDTLYVKNMGKYTLICKNVDDVCCPKSDPFSMFLFMHMRRAHDIRVTPLAFTQECGFYF